MKKPFIAQLRDIHADIADRINHVIACYTKESFEDTLTESSTLTELIDAVISIEADKLLPRLQDQMSMDDAAQIRRIHEEVSTVITSFVMVHVDEPRSEYIEKVEHLQRLHQEWMALDNDILLPTLEAHPETMEGLQLEDETLSRLNAHRALAIGKSA